MDLTNPLYWYGLALVLFALFLLVAALILRDIHRQDDGYEPIGDAEPPPRRSSPFRQPRR